MYAAFSLEISRGQLTDVDVSVVSDAVVGLGEVGEAGGEPEEKEPGRGAPARRRHPGRAPDLKQMEIYCIVIYNKLQWSRTDHRHSSGGLAKRNRTLFV